MATTPRATARPPTTTMDHPIAPLPSLEMPPAPDVLSLLGFNVLSAAGVALGVLVMLVARLLDVIYINNQLDGSGGSANRGLLHASSWTGYAGTILLVASLLMAALWGRRAHWGARVVLLALTLSVLLSSGGTNLAAFFGSLSNLTRGF